MTNRVIIKAPLSSRKRRIRTLRVLLWCFDHWVLVASTLFGVVLVVPFAAPVFMRLEWTGPAELIYTVYSTLCHQMAQRSFFLFGPQPMYNLPQLPVSLSDNLAADMQSLRAFVGSAELGWKVAWSDRMVYMYGGMWLIGIVFGLLRHRRRIQPLRLRNFVLLALPMVIDGGTHMLSDANGGLIGGFRYSNQWLADLTRNALPAWFYVGDAFGSFNSWMRLISGLTFALATVWLVYPYVDVAITETATELREKLARAEERLLGAMRSAGRASGNEADTNRYASGELKRRKREEMK